ncbi:hypothetical protein N8I74_15820 [Chitiniphilus purpureus]|uniref:Uncharacterized protein n=1 Tax=Chitiniphilus purpureus TaxID=2981137 RepID=A0ABY6DMQ3_9NEIS|nr:hypothetical protein [Chitiniphilus sp. CD1]UXY14771.1 hypothetical protein N8I74_15820 [Chitiniphilus sp. CD1]
MSARAELIANMLETPAYSPNIAANIVEALSEIESAEVERAWLQGAAAVERIVNDYWWARADQHLDKHPWELAEYIDRAREDHLAAMAERRAA